MNSPLKGNKHCTSKDYAIVMMIENDPGDMQKGCKKKL